MRRYWTAGNVTSITLVPELAPRLATLQQNFYTTSSCGVCGKASLVALRSVCPARVDDSFVIDADTLYDLHTRLRQAQSVFKDTGGIHSAALFSANGELLNIREDVGRHNALDKIIGAAMLEDEFPLRNRMLLLSAKRVMAGIPLVAAVGAPSSLAVAVAADFNVRLIGFLRDDHFNVYHGARRVRINRSGQTVRSRF